MSWMIQRQHDPAHHSEDENIQNSYVVRYPRVHTVFGLFNLALVCLFILLPFLLGWGQALDDDLLIYLIACWPFALLCLFMIWCRRRFTIEVNGDHLRFTPYFRRTREFYVSDISHICETNSGSIQGLQAYDFSGRKMFSVDAHAAGYPLLFRQLQPLLRDNKEGQLAESAVLKTGTGSIIFHSLFAVFFLIMAILPYSGGGPLVTIFLCLPFVLMLGLLLNVIIFRVTLCGGLLTIRRLFRGTVVIPVSEIRFGSRIISEEGGYAGMTLVDLSGRKILNVYSSYRDFYTFRRLFANMTGTDERKLL